MTLPSRLFARLWVIVPACALAFLIWIDVRRAEHVVHVTATAGWTGKESPRSASGAVRNGLIVPGHINASYQWILQTEQMLRTGDARIRRIDYENAPQGRTVTAASPYRWWLGLLAECDRLISGRPAETCVERAALVADPLLHVLLLAGTTLFVAWRFGVLAAALLAFGLTASFPLATVFLPGAPDDQSLDQVAAIWSMLALVTGAQTAFAGGAQAARSARRWFAVAGVVSGLGVWINPAGQFPLLGGIALSGLAVAWIAHRGRPEAGDVSAGTLPWRIWALSGSVTVLAGYLADYFPAHLGGWELRAVHPLYGLAWLGGGELLDRLAAAIEHRRLRARALTVVSLLVAILALVALPLAMWKLHDRGFLATDLDVFRLTKLPGSPAEPTFVAWLRRDGISPAVWAVILPFLLIGPAAWVASLRTTSRGWRAALLLALGPLIVGIGFACWQLAWWNEADTLLLVLLVVATASLQKHAGSRWPVRLWAAAAVLVIAPGVWRVWPQMSADPNALDESEVLGLIERDLAEWLIQHGPREGSIYVAPPNETSALTFHGAGRGLGTLSWENREGLEASVRILSASTPEEADALIQGRGITHLILPSWDPYLEEYARMGMATLEGSFLAGLRQWHIPSWLQPVPYRLPAVPGFEQQTITVFAVVQDQPPAAALSRTAEYFIELGQIDQARAVAQALRRYPADLGAWTARAEVEAAEGNEEAMTKSLKVVQSYLVAKRDRSLPWDLRAGLAVVLARGKDLEGARAQVKICLAQADEQKLRQLPTGSLYRLLVLARAFDESLADPTLHQLALDLLPAEARSRL